MSRYWRYPLLLIQVNTENKDIPCIYSYLIMDRNGLTSLFIPATSLNDTKTIFDSQATKLVMVNICS
jgi:hypothetical protein